MFMRFAGGGPGHGVPLPYYPLQLEKFYAIKKAVSGPSRGQDNGNESAEDIGRIQEEEDGLNDNEFEEYGYLQGLPFDNEEDMPEEAGGDLEENLGVEPGEDSGDDMDEAREVTISDSAP
ncbi:hypothetical protein FA13DRAFT_1775922 [Coprinellus micaceus]|uniref:Uncharacterized protein n=1 Tax=Coprinellus micaceus TaxID=71717 RepID=A0A4Y7T3G1_COPMI|nr:hypothetical protein FA13DRAFT_1775922 [Coprinellus micaceus]